MDGVLLRKALSRPGFGFVSSWTILFLCASSVAQKAPVTSARPWIAPSRDAPTSDDLQPSRTLSKLDLTHPYTLSQLIDLAEQQNPQTRALWQQAKVRAAELGIARSELLPTIAAVAIANTSRQGVLFGESFARQTLGLFEPVLRINYTILDFGERSDRITVARERLVAANFTFNQVHLDILFETARRYYLLLDQQGQFDASQLNLKNAQTVARAVEARLQVGLATLPDALEARAAAAQADYELQAVIGQVAIARAALLTILGEGPTQSLQVQSLDELNVPDHLDDQSAAALDRALAQRPELARRIAEKRAASASIRQARAAYLPTLDFQGEGGEVRAYGQQNLLPGTYAGPVEIWNTSLNLRWTLFDGGRREAQLARSHADERRAEAEIDATRDEIEQQVWIAYIDVQTALHQRAAAATLLDAARTSYDAALKSYTFGLRNTVDVVTAQRTLAQAVSQDVAARTGVLTQLAAFAYRTGDLLQQASRKAP
jgi:outer membrane protein